MPTSRIRAAGGVLWRERGGHVEVALVHRPRYDDWSLPKGKLGTDETAPAAAVREVGEETGSRVAVSRRLPVTRYAVAGVPKTVEYWAMRHAGGTFTPTDEVDELVWLPAGRARARLGYRHDRAVLDAFTAAPAPDAVIVLVRHAKAGKRAQWRGEDRLRPLEVAGRRQAAALAGFLPLFAPERVLSADPLRCVQTVEPLARRLGRTVEIAPEFGDERYLRDPGSTLDALRELGKAGTAVVVCSQGETIPGLVGTLRPAADPATRKGACWVLAFAAGAVVSADYYPAAP